MEITALQFEEMIDRLEKGSGQQVCVTVWGKVLLYVVFAHLWLCHPKKYDAFWALLC